MPIPDFQSIMLPLLRFAADGTQHTQNEAVDALAKEFQLSEVEKKELLPSGVQPVFSNRVAWARSHLKQAVLIENVQKGVFTEHS